MNARFGAVAHNLARSEFNWQISLPVAIAKQFGDRVIPSIERDNVFVEFSKDGRKLSWTKNSTWAGVAFSKGLVGLGQPTKRVRWDVEAKQVSTNPVVLTFPLPDLTGCEAVEKPRAQENSLDNLKEAARLFNSCLLEVGSTVKAYIRPDGTVWARQTIEKDI